MAIRLSTGLVNAMLGEIGFQKALKNGRIELRNGTQPSEADAQPYGALLGVVSLDGGLFVAGLPDNGLNFQSPLNIYIEKPLFDKWKFTALATGTATWFRFKGNAEDLDTESETAIRLDGTVGSIAADLIMNPSVIINNVYSIDEFIFGLQKQ